MTTAAADGRQAGRDRERDPYGWWQEGRDLLRAVAGASIVGMPLLYTQEMWSHRLIFAPWHLLALLAATLVANFAFSFLSGFRDEYSVASAVFEAITAVGIGIVFSTAVLWLIGELAADGPAAEKVGKVVVQAAVVSVGVAFANSQLLGKSRTEASHEEDENSAAGAGKQKEDEQRLQLFADLKDAAATLAGATVFTLNIAPTEEVVLVAARLVPWQQLAILGASGLLCYIILFAAGFGEPEVYVDSMFQHPAAETAMTFVLSLGVAFILLFFLGRSEALSHPDMALASTVALGMPAVVGGAAGRLIA